MNKGKLSAIISKNQLAAEDFGKCQHPVKYVSKCNKKAYKFEKYFGMLYKNKYVVHQKYNYNGFDVSSSIFNKNNVSNFRKVKHFDGWKFHPRCVDLDPLSGKIAIVTKLKILIFHYEGENFKLAVSTLHNMSHNQTCNRIRFIDDYIYILKSNQMVVCRVKDNNEMTCSIFLFQQKNGLFVLMRVMFVVLLLKQIK